jgi:hypothetical protein
MRFGSDTLEEVMVLAAWMLRPIIQQRLTDTAEELAAAMLTIEEYVCVCV